MERVVSSEHSVGVTTTNDTTWYRATTAAKQIVCLSSNKLLIHLLHLLQTRSTTTTEAAATTTATTAAAAALGWSVGCSSCVMTSLAEDPPLRADPEEEEEENEEDDDDDDEIGQEILSSAASSSSSTTSSSFEEVSVGSSGSLRVGTTLEQYHYHHTGDDDDEKETETGMNHHKKDNDNDRAKEEEEEETFDAGRLSRLRRLFVKVKEEEIRQEGDGGWTLTVPTQEETAVQDELEGDDDDDMNGKGEWILPSSIFSDQDHSFATENSPACVAKIFPDKLDYYWKGEMQEEEVRPAEEEITFEYSPSLLLHHDERVTAEDDDDDDDDDVEVNDDDVAAMMDLAQEMDPSFSWEMPPCPPSPLLRTFQTTDKHDPSHQEEQDTKGPTSRSFSADDVSLPTSLNGLMVTGILPISTNGKYDNLGSNLAKRQGRFVLLPILLALTAALTTTAACRMMLFGRGGENPFFFDTGSKKEALWNASPDAFPMAFVKSGNATALSAWMTTRICQADNNNNKVFRACNASRSVPFDMKKYIGMKKRPRPMEYSRTDAPTFVTSNTTTTTTTTTNSSSGFRSTKLKDQSTMSPIHAKEIKALVISQMQDNFMKQQQRRRREEQYRHHEHQRHGGGRGGGSRSKRKSSWQRYYDDDEEEEDDEDGFFLSTPLEERVVDFVRQHVIHRIQRRRQVAIVQ